MFIYGKNASGQLILKYTAADGTLQTITGATAKDIQAAKAATDSRISSNGNTSAKSVVISQVQSQILSKKPLTGRSSIVISKNNNIISNSNNNNNKLAVRGGSSTSNTYYDIDSALVDIKNKAAAYGVNLTIPATYGKSVTSSALAQNIVNSYVAKANELIAARYNTAAQPTNSALSSSAAKTSNYYDVDTALANVYAQAQKAGVKVSKPTSYGTSITDSKKAQSIIDAYTAAVNKQLSATSTTKASTTAKAGGAAAAKVAAATTTTYDISDAVKSLSATAKTYGVSATAPKTTSYKTQKEAQAAIDSYSAAIEKAYSTSVKAAAAKEASAAAAKNTTADYYSGSLNSSEQKLLDKWNARETANGTGKHYNPAYIKWYSEAPANTQSPPVYIEDAQKESAAVTAARNAANAKAEGQIADIQKELARSSALEAKGVVSHAANKITNASNMNGSSYSKGTASSGTVAASKTVPAKIITATTAKLASKVSATTAAVKSAATSKVISAQAPKLQAGTGSTAKATSANLAKLSKQVQTTNAKIIQASDSLIRTADIEKQGASNPNSKTPSTLYSSSAAEKAANASAYKKLIAAGKTTTQTRAAGATSGSSGRAATANAGYTVAVKAAKIEAETAKKLSAAFKDVVDKNNKAIAAIQTKGAASTGEAGVKIVRTDSQGNIKAVSKSASQYGAIQRVQAEQEKKALKDTLKFKSITGYAQKSYIPVNSASVTDIEKFQTIAEKAIAEAKKVNPQGSKEYFEGVANNARRSTLSARELLTEDMNSYRKGAAKITQAVIPSLDSIVAERDKLLSGLSIEATQTGSKWREGSSRKYTLKDVQQKYADKVNSNALGKAWVETGKEELSTMRNDPLKYIAQNAAEVAAGAALGAGLKAGTSLASSAMFKASLNPLIQESQTVGKLAAKSLQFGAAHIGQAANAGLIGGTIYDSGKVLTGKDEGQKIAMAKSFVLGGMGFTYGNKAGARIFDTVRSIGGKEVPVSDIVSEDILSGKTRFPETKKGETAADVQKMFKSNGDISGYHTSPGPITHEVRSSIARGTDNPGLYVAPQKAGASMYFSRIGKQAGFLDSVVEDAKSVKDTAKAVSRKDLTQVIRLKGIPESVTNLGKEIKSLPRKSIETVIGSSGVDAPSVNKIHLENNVKRMSADIRSDVAAVQKAAMNMKKGDAVLTYKMEKGLKGAPGGAELEATITPGTKLQKLDLGKKYFWYENEGTKRLVDLKDFKALNETGEGLKGPKSLEKTSEKFKNYSEYSSNKAGIKIGYGSIIRSATSDILSTSKIAASASTSKSRASSSVSSVMGRSISRGSSSVNTRSSTSKSSASQAYSGSKASRTPSSSAMAAVIPSHVTRSKTPDNSISHTSGSKSPRENNVSSSKISPSKSKRTSGGSTPSSQKYVTGTSSSKITSTVRIPSITGDVRAITETRYTPPTGGSSGKTSGRGSTGGGGLAFLHMAKKRKPDADSKKKKKPQKYLKRTRNEQKLKRTIFNKLGSLKTMLG